LTTSIVAQPRGGDTPLGPELARLPMNHREIPAHRVGPEADGRRLTIGAQVANLPYEVNLKVCGIG
jgi:hypothetical protein